MATAPAALALLLLIHATSAEDPGYASCYGNYHNDLASNSVACGLGSFIDEVDDFTYTTAICSDWVHPACGSCYNVSCTSGKTGNMGCSGRTTKVRVIDSLGSGCGAVTKDNHVFDLNDVPYSELAMENDVQAGCSGEIYVGYTPVSCDAVGIAKGGLKVGILPGQCDPWCPPFWFSNVGGAGALFSVEVSYNGGSTWNKYERNKGNGCRWDCKSGEGNYMGKALSFKLQTCTLDDLPNSCTASGRNLTLTSALPPDWCSNSASPCTSKSWQLSDNFGSEDVTTVQTTTAQPTTAKPTTAQPTVQTTTAQPTTAKPTTAQPTTPLTTTAQPVTTGSPAECRAVPGNQYGATDEKCAVVCAAVGSTKWPCNNDSVLCDCTSRACRAVPDNCLGATDATCAQACALLPPGHWPCDDSGICGCT